MTKNTSDYQFIRYLPGDLVSLTDGNIGIVVTIFQISPNSSALGARILCQHMAFLQSRGPKYYCELKGAAFLDDGSSSVIRGTLDRMFIPKYYNSPVCDELRCPTSKTTGGCDGCPVKRDFVYVEPKDRIYFPFDSVYLPEVDKLMQISALGLDTVYPDSGIPYQFTPVPSGLPAAFQYLGDDMEITEFWEVVKPASRIRYYIGVGGSTILYGASRYSGDLRLRHRRLFYRAENDIKALNSMCKMCIYDKDMCETCNVREIKDILCQDKS